MPLLIFKIWKNPLRMYARYFLSVYPKQTFLTKFALSFFGKALFGNSFINLEYWLRTYPICKDYGVFAKIDFVRNVEPQGYSIRGWIFHRERPIKSASIMINGNVHQVLCCTLLRLDVNRVFPYLPHSKNSGFVFYYPLSDTAPAPSDISFRIYLEGKDSKEDEVIDGYFFSET